jgi:hypothetical protein
MKKLLSALVLVFSSQSANAILSMTIEDGSGGLPDELYTDIATPGSLTITTAISPILGNFYDTGSIQSVISNYTSGDDFANLISSSINLNGASIFDDDVIINLVGEYTQPAGDRGDATTTLNAATLVDASFDAVVTVSNTPIFSELDIADLNIRTATETVDLLRGVGDAYPIRHAFRLSSAAVGSDLGFDISTRVDAVVPTPAPLALLGLGLIGLIGARKVMR